MSTDDQTQNDNGTEELEGVQKPDELGMLKQRARIMGITFSNNIGIETLKAKIHAKQEGEPDPDELPKTDDLGDDPPVVTQQAQQNPPMLQDPQEPPVSPKETIRQRVKREGMKLVRLRIMNLDPKKKDLPGEIFTIANDYLGTVKKFVPFGEVTENGYHVPHCIYEMMKGRKFLHIRTYKDRKNNNQIRVEQSWAPEFSLEVLPPLTKDEISKLAAAQSAAGGLSD